MNKSKGATAGGGGGANATARDSEQIDTGSSQDPKIMAEKKVHDEMAKGQQKLILENSKLQDLSFLTGIQWESLQEIDLHKNYLSSIDILNQFRNLRLIRASDNYIEEISLNLQRLEELDLHNNYINKFPLINQLPKIQKLNLNANKIEDLRIDFKPPSSLALVYLDLGNNRLEFQSHTEFQQFLDRMKKLKNLKVLIINLVEKQNDLIVAQLPQLEMFNNERADEYRRKVLEEDKTNQGGGKKGKGKAKGKSKVDKTKFFFPSLELLCYNLEAANSHPAYALDHLRDLSSDVDKISEHLEMVDEYFVKDKSDEEIHDMIEDFMQNSQLLINNQYELQNIMLTILSKLSIIKRNDFGIKCFNTLKDLMIAGKDMEDKVINIIKKEVINKLQQQNPEMIPASLLQGLYELVDLTGKVEILTGLYENCFPTWLRILQERVIACRKIAAIYEDNSHFDSIIALMSCSLKEPYKNVEKAVEKELVPIISDIVNESTWEKQRYINCLRIVEVISMNHAEAAGKFIDRNVHGNIVKNINNSLSIYRKNNDLKDEDSKDTNETLKKKYLTLAAEIDCMGGLLNADKQKRQVLLQPSELAENLLQIISHPKTDPVLLTSICRFAKQVLSRDEIKCVKSEIEKYCKKMQNLVPLVPYMGMKKYSDALIMARKYYDQSAFADKEKETQLSHLDDVIVQRLFIAIINLINFFCEEAENRLAAQETLAQVSDALNENGREAGLFNCLQVPNDEVKLAVVECLNNVPLSEFDTEEIATILRLLGSYKNIGVGKTELVLAKIFWILTKLTKDKENDSGKNFRLKFGEKAINEALDILIRNLQRYITDEDEEGEKLALSLSCLNFLKFASINSDMKKYMVNKHDQLKEALYADEQNTSYKMSKVPIELEDTQLGNSIDVLLHCINGNETIDPYNYVSFRLLQRMADVLMNKEEEEVIDPFDTQNGEVFEILEDHYRDKFKRRIKSEKTYWQDPEDDFVIKIQANDEAYTHYLKQHSYFTNSNGIYQVRMFLTKKVPDFEQQLKREYDMSYDKTRQQLLKMLNQMKEKTEFKEHEHQRKEEESKGQAMVIQDEQQEEEKGLDILRMTLQSEELGQHYDPSKSSDQFLSTSSKQTANMENILKRDNKTGVNNMKIRSLCIAAYLRCLFAAIEYAPTPKLRKDAIVQLKDIFAFRLITQLCDTTGWLEAGIGAKYLRIMKHIIKAQLTDNNESFDNIAHYEVMSIAIRKMLNQVMIKIKNEQQTPLSNEDKILIYELSSTCQLMCKQCQLFQWSNVEVKQFGSHSRTRRSPQEKIIDKQISWLFPSQSILTFIAIIFRDMSIAQKVFDNGGKVDGQDAEHKVVKEKMNMARELIKQFLGDYLSKCKENKYDVLEAFMKGVVFEKKKLRESYLQEILNSHSDASYASSIENFLLKNKLGFDPEEKERINFLTWCLANTSNQPLFETRLLILTNKGVHIMKKPKGKPCSVCPPENLCPNGPVPEFKFKYEMIVELLTFPDLPQKFQAYFSWGPTLGTKDQALPVNFIIPNTTSAKSVLVFAKEVAKLLQTPFYDDYMLIGSLMTHAEPDSRVKFARYVSHNPQKKLFSFGSAEETIIPNCKMLVLTNKQIILFNEHWHKWYNVNNLEVLEIAIDKIQNEKRGVKNENEEEEVQSLVQKQQEAKMRGALEGTLKPVFAKLLGEIKDLHVHKGKDPVVEIQFEKGGPEKFIFQCDYSRQQFIETLIELKLNPAQDDK